MEKRLLPTAQWKVVLVALTLFLFGMFSWPLAHWERLIDPGRVGTLAAQLGPPDHDYRQRIISIAPESPLAAAGAQAGDSVDFIRRSDSVRKFGIEELVPLRLTTRTGQSRELLLRPVALTTPASIFAARNIGLFVSTFVALGIGFLIGFRRADSTAMRVMALSLMALVVEMATYHLPPGAIAELNYKVLWPFGDLATFLGLSYFALKFPESRPHWRRGWVRKLFYLFASAWVVQTAAILLYRLELLPQALQPLVRNAGRESVLDLFTAATVLLASWFSWRQSSGSERQRMAWIGACFSFLYAWFAAPEFIDLLGVKWNAAWMPLCQAIGIAISYLGLGYAILRHKVFDVGFAVNRALVYSIMSALLLTLFGLTEFAVDKLLHFEGREKNVIFDAAVALGVILTFHRIQHWINHRVDHVFFHHWQAAADKLRAFVERAPHMLEPDALQARFMHAVEEFGGARGMAIYWADADGKLRLAHATLADVPASIDGDDDVAVDLRHTRAVVDLSGARGTLPADLVFPLLAHNQVAGMLLVGAKAGGQAWRPDEIALLGTSVPRICMVLEALRLQKLERSAAELAAQLSLVTAEREAAIAKAALAEMKLAGAALS